ncbi:MAG: hypothetical protein K2L67_04295 [Clostridia bacterium]|nr:hypothetical protein [Clostridia bacterium]
MQNGDLYPQDEDFGNSGDFENDEDFEKEPPREQESYEPDGNAWGRGHYISDNENKNITKPERIAMCVFIVAWIALTAVLFLLGVLVEGFPFVGWVYSLFGGAMIFAVAILMVKITANARYKRGKGKKIKNFKAKIAASVIIMLAFGACAVCGFIFNISWLMIAGFAGLIIMFFVMYGAWF